MTTPKIMSLSNTWNITYCGKKIVKPQIFPVKAVVQTTITSH